MTNAPIMHDTAHLLSEIAKGKTLYIRTMTRITKVDQKCVARFAKNGNVVLKNGATTGRPLMASGRKFVDIGFCDLELV